MLRIMAKFKVENSRKWYGPIDTKVQVPYLTQKQCYSVKKESKGTWPHIRGCFFVWLNVHDTMQGMLWI